MRYTYSDDEYGSDGVSSKRSARTSGIDTPLESGPTVTASGRQVKSRVGGVYGESILMDQRKELERIAGEGHLTETSEDMPTTAPKGRGVRISRSGREVKAPRPRYGDGMDSEESEEAQSSGKEWSGNEDEPDESEPDFDEDGDEDMDDENLDAQEGEEDENTQESLVVQLRYRKGDKKLSPSAASSRNPSQPPHSNAAAVVVNGTKLPVKPPPATVPVDAMGDTIDVAPRPKHMNGNSIEPQQQQYLNGSNGISQPSHPAVEIPVQPMDVS